MCWRRSKADPVGQVTARLIGFDPGLRRTGWGVIEQAGSRLIYVAEGVIATDESRPLAERLVALHTGLLAVLDRWAPDEAAVEESFVNMNPTSTLRLGMARGVVMLAPSERGLDVAEYAPNRIKKALVGVGHADKIQVQTMVRHLLPGALGLKADAADALAVAICHAHFRTQRVLLVESARLGA
jgi:crossover junction endodeoxyribonuclease RuvC